MKRFVILFALMFTLVAFVNAQKVYTITADTLNGAETVNFGTIVSSTKAKDITIQALCTQVGGTSDGTLTVYGSVDGTSYSFVNGVGADVITASPKASITGADLNQITITNGLVASWVIRNAPYKYYRVTGVGTANDSTLVTVKYLFKE